jgi:hypothetical protein
MRTLEEVLEEILTTNGMSPKMRLLIRELQTILNENKCKTN